MDSDREKTVIKEFGERLKKFRDERNLSLRDLGHLADIDFGNINEIEKGKINPSLTTIVALAEALKISPSQFFHDNLV